MSTHPIFDAGGEETGLPDPDGQVSDAETWILTVPESASGTRLDAFLPDAFAATEDAPELSRAAAVRLIEEGWVALESDGRSVPANKKTRLRPGDRLTVTLPAPRACTAQPENIPLHIVYEDEDILVVNKPAGMVVHPAPGNQSGTLVNALLYHCGDSLSGIGGVIRPGIVHRIDKDTSGLLVVAKNDMAHLSLAEQLKTHTVSRVYSAVCVGNLREDRGTINLPIGRNPADRKKMAVFPGADTDSDAWGQGSATVRAATTHYRVLERYPLGARWGQAFTYVQCELETGRTHQIRVHMAALGHPLLGDPLYGGDGTRFGRTHASLLTGQALHAGQLRLIHPRTATPMLFTCDPPCNFLHLLDVLRQEAGYA